MLLQIASIAPIALLIFLLLNRWLPIPPPKAMPISAAVLYILKMLFFRHEVIELHAAIAGGALTAMAPLSIVGGAFFLARTLKVTPALRNLQRGLQILTPHRTAHLMIVGWAFAFLIEGCAGAGTPAAMAAPVLVGLGFAEERVAAACLMFNSAPVSFGAVGMPLWFGLKDLKLGDDALRLVAVKSAVFHAVGSLLIVFLACLQVLPKSTVRENSFFILLSWMSCVGPYVLVSFTSYELPSLVGGSLGLIFTCLLAKYGVGLAPEDTAPSAIMEEGTARKELPLSWGDILKSIFPLVGTVVMLWITRINLLPFKRWLTDATPLITLPLGKFGIFKMSSSLVVGIDGLLSTKQSWSHPILFIPSLLPFVVVSSVSLYSFAGAGQFRRHVTETAVDTLSRLQRPMKALAGSMIFVKLLTIGGPHQQCTKIISSSLAALLGQQWMLVSAFLGALGSFFSGSNLFSNMTFAGIQDHLAMQLRLNRTTVLALQNVGGAMGNMSCINNIIAISAVIGMQDCEARIMKNTIVPCLLYGIVVTLAAHLIHF